MCFEWFCNPPELLHTVLSLVGSHFGWARGRFVSAFHKLAHRDSAPDAALEASVDPHFAAGMKIKSMRACIARVGAVLEGLCSILKGLRDAERNFSTSSSLFFLLD